LEAVLTPAAIRMALAADAVAIDALIDGRSAKAKGGNLSKMAAEPGCQLGHVKIEQFLCHRPLDEVVPQPQQATSSAQPQQQRWATTCRGMGGPAIALLSFLS
jgi:hypothetical protein